MGMITRSSSSVTWLSLTNVSNAGVQQFTSAICLTAAEVEAVFPFYFVIDDRLRIVAAGSTLCRLLPDLKPGVSLDGTFQVELPDIPATITDIRAYTHKLFKFRSLANEKLVLKGQMQSLANGTLVFFGSPWPSANADFVELGLSLKDFAIHDSTPDFVLQMYSLRHALNDASRLNERLVAFNRDLEQRIEVRTREVVEANRVLELRNQELHHEMLERMRAEEQIRQLAYFDPLTGLANRSLLGNRLTQAMAARRRDGRLLALMFIDLDRFKPINDTYGHHVGDNLLKVVAERLNTCVRECDTVARLGGDEFIVVLTEVGTTADVAQVAEKLSATLAAPYLMDGLQLETTPSIGVGLFPNDGDDGDALMRNADSAMYLAKKDGRNRIRFFGAA